MVEVSQFKGQTVFITGASQGIGEAIAVRLADEGANIIVADINLDGGSSTVDKLEAVGTGRYLFVHCDVTKEASVDSAFEEAIDTLGPIGILCNNAGTITMAKTQDLTLDEWNLNMDVNARGTFLCVRRAIPHFLSQGGGIIVNIASQAGKRGYPLFSHYCASKAAVINFTRAVAVEYAPQIRINCVCPGIVNTDMMEREYAWETEMTGELREEIEKRWMSAIPMGRFQEPEQIAGVVAFLASSESSEMTGQAINVTGGMVME